MIDSIQTWKHWLEGKEPVAMAEQIVGNLMGCRSSSTYREQDIKTLSNAICAIIELKKEKK